MTFDEIRELVQLVNELELAEFKLRNGEFEMAIRTKFYDKTKKIYQAPSPQVVTPAVPAPAPPAEAPPAETGARKTDAAPAAPEAKEEDHLVPIKSPIVGTFYRSPAPEKPVYIKVGDIVEVGSVVCIVEAMKLFNEIESEVTGKVVKVLVEDASPVEYDQVLFLVDPNG